MKNLSKEQVVLMLLSNLDNFISDKMNVNELENALNEMTNLLGLTTSGKEKDATPSSEDASTTQAPVEQKNPLHKKEDNVPSAREMKEREARIKVNTEKLIDQYIEDKAFYGHNDTTYNFINMIKDVLFDFCMWAREK